MIKVSSAGVRPEQVTDQGASGTTIRQLIGKEQGAPTFAIRLFELEQDGRTPLHSHWWEHEVYCLEGEGEVETPEGPVPLRAGDAVLVPPNEQHQFRNAGQGALKFLCMIPVERPCGKG